MKKAKKANKSSKRVARDPAELVEKVTERIFRVELRDVLGRLADEIEQFVGMVELEFSAHPSGCRVSMFRHRASGVWTRVGSLRADAQRLLLLTIETYAVGSPVLDEPLGCKRQPRMPHQIGKPLPRRTKSTSELLGWLTPNEQRLIGMLRPQTPAVLESREAVDSRRAGIVSGVNAKGELVTESHQALAESDDSIATFFPLLVQPGMDQYAMAVSDACLERLRKLANALREWSPERVRERHFRPHGTELVRVLHTKPRDADLKQKHGNERTATKPPLSDRERAVLALLTHLPEGEGLTGREICDALADGSPKFFVDQSALTRQIIPILRTHYGVTNRPRVGYYVQR